MSMNAVKGLTMGTEELGKTSYTLDFLLSAEFQTSSHTVLFLQDALLHVGIRKVGLGLNWDCPTLKSQFSDCCLLARNLRF